MPLVSSAQVGPTTAADVPSVPHEACGQVGPTAADVQPVSHEALDRFLTGLVTALPFLGLGLAAWQLWDRALGWSDLLVFSLLYFSTGFGITVGFHRLFTHRSFKAKPAVRVALAVLGSAAVEGPVLSWVADHRKHHAFADRFGDPHSPHVGRAPGLRGILSGLGHAHLGWLFVHDQRASHTRYAPDLLADSAIAWVNRTFFVWVAMGFAVPFALGYVIGGSLWSALTGLLWGGLVRMLVLHHVTYSINSLCHVFGRRPYDTDDESRNLAWLALPSMGESWHNNHHACPTSARHGMRFWQIDLSAYVIAALARCGLAWDVKRG